MAGGAKGDTTVDARERGGVAGAALVENAAADYYEKKTF